MKITLLTGGSDRPYALGLVEALLEKGLSIDIVGSDEFLGAELVDGITVRLLNLRGDTGPSVPLSKKALRTLRYYVSLLKYTANTDTRIFHVLWANRFWFLDRVVMNLVYKAFGKRLFFTAHNINERERDGNDNTYNRLTLRLMYGLMDHVFVHTAGMKEQLISDFGVATDKVSIIPFGINNTFPRTPLSGQEARTRLGIDQQERALLVFGRIAPYKGIEYAVEALKSLNNEKGQAYRLVVAGRVEQGCHSYWRELEEEIHTSGLSAHVIKRIDYIPDAEVEVFFKAADVLLLPYKAIFQSGLLFLTYSFGLPVITTDVGSFREDVLEGVTGYVCAARNGHDLAATVQKYFASDLYTNIEFNRAKIREWGNNKYSWKAVADTTLWMYQRGAGV